jgi:hypothetical protein
MSHKNKPTEHESTRMSVCLRLSLILFASGFLIGAAGMIGFTGGLAWCQFPLGIGCGLLLAAGLVGFDAIKNSGVRRTSIVCE